MKQQANKKRSDRKFHVGDLVYVKLQPYRQTTVANRNYLKLSTKYFGPFSVLARLGAVAYKLDLPPTSKIYPVLHVSQLKQHIGPVLTQPSLPLVLCFSVCCYLLPHQKWKQETKPLIETIMYFFLSNMVVSCDF